MNNKNRNSQIKFQFSKNGIMLQEMVNNFLNIQTNMKIKKFYQMKCKNCLRIIGQKNSLTRNISQQYKKKKFRRLKLKKTHHNKLILKVKKYWIIAQFKFHNTTIRMNSYQEL